MFFGVSVALAAAQTSPSSSFTLGKPLRNSAGGAVVAATFPGPGSVVVTDAGAPPIPLRSDTTGCAQNRCGSPGSYKPKVRHVVTPVSAAGTLQLKIQPTAAAKKKLFGGGSLKIRASVAFTPTGGSASTQFVTMRLIRVPTACGASRFAAHTACSPPPPQ